MTAHKYSMSWREVKASKPIVINVDRVYDYVTAILGAFLFFLICSFLGS